MIFTIELKITTVGVLPQGAFCPTPPMLNHGEREYESPRIWSGGLLMQSVPQIVFCFKISSTRLLASQCSKKLINPITLKAYSLASFQKYIFNVHQITTSGAKFNIFLARARQKYRSEFTKTRHVEQCGN